MATRLETRKTGALVIGSGISGLFTALKLAEAGVQTMLVTKSSVEENNSRYAQGGIAAVLPNNTDDSIDLHIKDTIRASAGLCDEAAVRSILSEGYEAILDLLAHGVRFDRRPDNELALTREAAHSVKRILHAAGDATGHSVEMTLIDRVVAHPNIEIMDYCHVVSLIKEGDRILGCRAVLVHGKREIILHAEHTVLATGGAGRLFLYSTNPTISTGEGVAHAFEAGADVKHMEFFQFHPTAFYATGSNGISGPQFLISEALRGEGGVLLNRHGERFMTKYHADGELAPRDIVTRAIYEEMRLTEQPCVYLDISHLPKETIESRFPTILKNCLTFDVDIRTDKIPVTPAAHYMMGGVVVDLDGKTSVENLYAVGEVACTGLHGANRLASNSLLECVVFARRVAEAIAKLETNPPTFPAVTASEYRFEKNGDIQQALDELHVLMWRHVGILRDEAGLKTALNTILDLQNRLIDNQWQRFVPQGVELANQLTTARLITVAALNREGSLGAHYRTDAREPVAV